MEAGDLLLVDAAANYQGLTGDITRTYPINGTFSAAQREIYEIVYAAQEAGEQGREGRRARERHPERVRRSPARRPRAASASSPSRPGTQFKIWSTHGVTHWIGMDVHDVGSRARPLEPGMAFVIEPGIYIREAALDNLPKTAANAAFIEKIRPAVQRYKDIGVRIEDSFLLTASRPRAAVGHRPTDNRGSRRIDEAAQHRAPLAILVGGRLSPARDRDRRALPALPCAPLRGRLPPSRSRTCESRAAAPTSGRTTWRQRRRPLCC